MVLLCFSPTTVALLGCTVVLLYLAVSYVLSYRKLRQFKGPTLASLSQYWLFKTTLQSQVSTVGADVLKKYGRGSPMSDYGWQYLGS